MNVTARFKEAKTEETKPLHTVTVTVKDDQGGARPPRRARLRPVRP